MQGWCKFYEFSDADLRAGLEVLAECFGPGGIKWDYVHGLYSNAIFGGRIDDVQDGKVLLSYLRDFFNPRVISERPSQKLGDQITLISNSEGDSHHRGYLEMVNKMSDDDSPSLFGLPANIRRTHQKSTSASTIGQLRRLMRSAEGGEKFEREKWSTELSPILNLWKKLNTGSNSLIQAKERQVTFEFDGVFSKVVLGLNSCFLLA